MKEIMDKLKNVTTDKKKLLLVIPVIIIIIAILMIIVGLILRNSTEENPIYKDAASLNDAIVEASINYLDDCLKSKKCEYNLIKDADLEGKITKQYEEIIGITIDNLVRSGKLKISGDKVLDANNQNIGPCAVTVTKITDFQDNKKITYKVTSSFDSYKENDKTIKCPVSVGEEYPKPNGENNG